MPSKMKNMISKDLFCSSPASTAICSSNGLKPLHPLHSNLNHHYKTLTNNNNNNNIIYNLSSSSSSSSSSKIPCLSQLPFTPRPHHRLKTQTIGSSPRRNSTTDFSADRIHYLYKHNTNASNIISTGYTSPARHSSRYLLGDRGLGTGKGDNRSSEKEVRKCRSEKQSHWSLIDANNKANNDDGYKKVIKSDINGVKYCCGDYGQRHKIMGQCKGYASHSPAVKSSVNAPAPHYGEAKHQEVVVLRVSLHCKCRGCESKLRKHLSKLQGVTSFSIDLEVKKVTVVGNVSPLEVLTSISKVKNAQFWPSPTSSTSTTSSTLDLSY